MGLTGHSQAVQTFGHHKVTLERACPDTDFRMPCTHRAALPLETDNNVTRRIANLLTLRK